jgi:hypothetical protein
VASSELILDRGHETVASTVRDGWLDDVLEMPSESGWPIVVALLTGIGFTMVLLDHFLAATAFAGFVGLALAAWHWHEPEHA